MVFLHWLDHCLASLERALGVLLLTGLLDANGAEESP